MTTTAIRTLLSLSFSALPPLEGVATPAGVVVCDVCETTAIVLRMRLSGAVASEPGRVDVVGLDPGDSEGALLGSSDGDFVGLVVGDAIVTGEVGSKKSDGTGRFPAISALFLVDQKLPLRTSTLTRS